MAALNSATPIFHITMTIRWEARYGPDRSLRQVCADVPNYPRRDQAGRRNPRSLPARARCRPALADWATVDSRSRSLAWAIAAGVGSAVSRSRISTAAMSVAAAVTRASARAALRVDAPRWQAGDTQYSASEAQAPPSWQGGVPHRRHPRRRPDWCLCRWRRQGRWTSRGLPSCRQLR